jgi:hypothetical protein
MTQAFLTQGDPGCFSFDNGVLSAPSIQSASQYFVAFDDHRAVCALRETGETG